MLLAMRRASSFVLESAKASSTKRSSDLTEGSDDPSVGALLSRSKATRACRIIHQKTSRLAYGGPSRTTSLASCGSPSRTARSW